MATAEEVLHAALALGVEERRQVYLKLGEALAPPSEWNSQLHPAWREELARRDAMPEEDDIPWEVVKQEMRAMFEEIDRTRDRGGES